MHWQTRFVHRPTRTHTHFALLARDDSPLFKIVYQVISKELKHCIKLYKRKIEESFENVSRQFFFSKNILHFNDQTSHTVIATIDVIKKIISFLPLSSAQAGQWVSSQICSAAFVRARGRLHGYRTCTSSTRNIPPGLQSST